ncbi:MAG: hypothetical protein J6X02_00955, partial [Bacilli bacterium]|nr:hypothetical protein [Bacilli bacterium]
MMDEFNIIKRKKKKNAFASTALLASIGIAVLAIILIVLLMGKSRTTKTDTIQTYSGNGADATCTSAVKEEKFTNNLRTIKEAAMSYFTVDRMPKNVGDSIKLTLKEMQKKKLVLDMYDSTGKKCSTENTYVEVTKDENEYVMKLHLSCDDMEDYIVVHIGCYDFCDGKICEDKVTYEYEYKKTVSCTMSPWSDWGEWQTKRESTNSNKKEETKTEIKTKEVVETKDANKSVTCPDGYDKEGNKCIKVTIKRIDATLKPECPYGYEKDGDRCKKVVSHPEIIDATVEYDCPTGYTPSGSQCKKYESIDATATLVCPSGYTPKNGKCVIEETINATATLVC